MNPLVIGGSVFLGKHVVEAALDRGHEVTVFNRGIRSARYSKPVEHVQGDRVTDLNRLRARQFHSVIDCCAYKPEHTGLAAPGVVYDETSAAVAQGHVGYSALKARAE